MYAEMTWPGLAETLAMFRRAPAVMQQQILPGAVAAACQPIREEAAIRAPYWTGPAQEGHPPPGTLQRSIYQTRLTSECTPTREVWIVTVRKGAKAASVAGGSKDAFYGTWVEYGHYARGPSARSAAERKGLDAGSHVPLGSHFILAQPYMRPAFEVKKSDAVEAMRAFIEKKLPLISKA